MKILYVAAEAAPFFKTGGLADVAGSLPKALNNLGLDCRVVLPMHSQLDDRYRAKLVKINEYYVHLGWKREYCGVYELIYDGVTYYFLNNDYYFRRDRLYGDYDDGERYIFFSRAAAMLPKMIKLDVDVIHSNDWHTGLVPVYVDDFRTGDPFYKDIRTLYSIHNLKYQGEYPLETFYWTNLPGQFLSDYDLKFYDSINLMKAGIVHANRVNTVSKTYAQEIRYPYFAEGLELVTRAYAEKISGILNGIDYQVWQTEDNPYLVRTYSPDKLEGRKANKAALQKRYGLPVSDAPIIAMISRLTAMKGLDLVSYILDELLQEDIQFIVLGTGELQYEDFFRQMAVKYPDKCSARIYYSNEESHQLYSASDFLLMPSISEPCGLSQMIAMRYGSIPIVREVGGLRDSVKDYNPVTGRGEGFTFQSVNAHDMLFSIKNGLLYYRERPEEFARIQQNAMRKNLDWSTSSLEYRDLYESMLEDC